MATLMATPAGTYRYSGDPPSLQAARGRETPFAREATVVGSPVLPLNTSMPRGGDYRS